MTTTGLEGAGISCSGDEGDEESGNVGEGVEDEGDEDWGGGDEGMEDEGDEEWGGGDEGLEDEGDEDWGGGDEGMEDEGEEVVGLSASLGVNISMERSSPMYSNTSISGSHRLISLAQCLITDLGQITRFGRSNPGSFCRRLRMSPRMDWMVFPSPMSSARRAWR